MIAEHADQINPKESKQRIRLRVIANCLLALANFGLAASALTRNLAPARINLPAVHIPEPFLNSMHLSNHGKWVNIITNIMPLAPTNLAKLLTNGWYENRVSKISLGRIPTPKNPAAESMYRIVVKTGLWGAISIILDASGVFLFSHNPQKVSDLIVRTLPGITLFLCANLIWSRIRWGVSTTNDECMLSDLNTATCVSGEFDSR